MLIYLTLYCLKHYTNINLTFSTGAIAIFGVFCFIYTYRKHTELHRFLIILLLLGMFSVFASVVNRNGNMIYALTEFSLEILGVLLYLCKDRLHVISEYSKILLSILFVLAILAYWNRENIDDPVYISDTLGSSSFSVFALFFLAIILADCLWNHFHYPYAYIIVALILAVLLNGMGGIVTITLLLFGLLLKSKKNKFSIGKMYFFLGMALILLLLFGYNLNFIWAIAKDDNGRIAIWSYYWDLVSGNVQNMLFGANISGNWILMLYQNMHNLFLNYHCFFGSAVLIFYVFIIAIQEVKYIKEQKFIPFLILNVLLLRSLTDAAELYSAIWIFLYLSECKNTKEIDPQGELSV